MSLATFQKKFRAHKNPERAKTSARFFKTGKGQYGEGDQFLGITVPEIRRFAKDADTLSLHDIETLLISPWHEERLLAIILLVARYRRAPSSEKHSIYTLYLRNIPTGINNWDIVDTSAAPIVGAHLEKMSRKDLYTLAHSENIWKKRVAIVATHYFIRQDDFTDTLALCTFFLQEKHDLLHKACGWMLREVGKRDVAILRQFLHTHTSSMPRTMLRYAIEHLSPEERHLWMSR